MSSNMQEQLATSYLGNVAYLNNLYEDYLQDPDNVPLEWQNIFNNLPKNNSNKEVSPREIENYFLQAAKLPKTIINEDQKQSRVSDLINAYRSYGHQIACLDPLALNQRPPVPSLELNYHHLTKNDLNNIFFINNYIANESLPLHEILTILQQTYCGSIGIEYMHITNTVETEWLQQKMEAVRGKANFSTPQKLAILNGLIAAEGLERYLGTRYVGQKRFSLEGGDALIPLMREIIEKAGDSAVNDITLGMAHRGRLNVLVNVLGKEPNELFKEFEGTVRCELTGDVKYHLGYSSDLATKNGNIVHLALAFNPSHLEIIGPVVEGAARSKLRRRHNLEKKDKVIPIIIHGDAAFAGQGVVMEMLNFSQARGYSTGGTIHIVINNQIGFTTSNPLDSRSTLYCTDVAKMVQAPIIHVNGNDPEAVIYATQIAFDFRMKFKRDVLIDLVCYRRHGHNEADEPSITQPLMYNAIKAMPTLRELYAKKLINEGLVTSEEVDKSCDDYRKHLDEGEVVVNTVHGDYPNKLIINWKEYINAKWTDPADTTISKASIEKLSNTLFTLPPDFIVHPVVKRLLTERQQMTQGEQKMNWGYAETMAFASLLAEGYSIRLSGQDSARGTFAHRHAVLHNMKNGESYAPLSKIAKDPQVSFEVIDSILSEEAVLAFEYGYAASEPSSLVIWEAQFGDFANGAQVVIDQFISSGEQKWGRLCGLVMLLPHGYEGQGPEHSSARLERYLQLCAQENIQVCTPSTASQIFHLLRRQLIRKFRKPLIIMSPKSLLRHKLASSPLSDLTSSYFYDVIPEIDQIDAKKVNKVVLCCGKVYYDLLEKRREQKLEYVAILRLEQLYPFPQQILAKELEKFSNATKIVWCQEEPKNQGAWLSCQDNIKSCLNEKQQLYYAGREATAAPAVGSLALHTEEQMKLVAQALAH